MKRKLNMKKILLGITTAIAVGLMATTAIASAYQGDPTTQGPNYDADLHDLKVDAFESGDYAVWKDLMEQSGARGRVLEVVNEDNFDVFVQAHNAALDGDLELAAQLRAEIGLNNGNGPADGTGYQGMNKQGSGQGMRAQGQGLGRQ